MAELNEKIVLSNENLEKIGGADSDYWDSCLRCEKCGYEFPRLETHKYVKYDSKGRAIHIDCGGLIVY